MSHQQQAHPNGPASASSSVETSPAPYHPSHKISNASMYGFAVDGLADKYDVTPETARLG